MTQALKPLSEAIFEPLNRAYKAGGFGLAILSLGALLMLLAYFWKEEGPFRLLFLFSGLLMVMLPAGFFYLKDIRPLLRAQNSVEQNKELIDSVQRTAIELTELASDLQSLAFKHAKDIGDLVQRVKPLLAIVPGLTKLTESEAFISAERLSIAIVDTTVKAKEVIKNLETALVQSNPAGLKRYLAELSALRGEVERILRKGEARAVQTTPGDAQPGAAGDAPQAARP